MNGKKILSFVLAAALASGFNSMTSLAAIKKITTVSLTVEAETIPGGSIFDQQVEITVKNSKIEVGNYEFTNAGFQWSGEDIPRLEVELYAQDGYYFATTGSSFTISGGTYVSQKKEDSSQTLTVTIDLPKVSQFTQDIGEAFWNTSAIAGWSPAAGAGSYEVKLYRDGKTVGTVKKTGDTRWDFAEAMTKAGNYTFRVRPVNKEKPDNVGEWKESPVKYVDGAAAEQNRVKAAGGNGDLGNGTSGNGTSGNGASGTWKQDQTGWWYLNGDGSYTVNNWQSIDGQWYFFNEKGYMAAGWISWNGKQYYCDVQSGRMLANGMTPDGYKVGADGARIP